MSYFVASMEKVQGQNKENYPEYVSVLADLERAAFARAAAIWDGWTPGGIFPGPQKFGVGPLRKNDMSADTTDSARSGSYSWQISTTSIAWRDVFNYTVPRDFIHAIAGFTFANDVLRFQQVRIRIGDRLYPILDFAEAVVFDKFNLVFKMDKGQELIAEPGQTVLVRMYPISQGTQIVKPIGLNLYRNLNSVINET